MASAISSAWIWSAMEPSPSTMALVEVEYFIFWIGLHQSAPREWKWSWSPFSRLDGRNQNQSQQILLGLVDTQLQSPRTWILLLSIEFLLQAQFGRWSWEPRPWFSCQFGVACKWRQLRRLFYARNHLYIYVIILRSIIILCC